MGLKPLWLISWLLCFVDIWNLEVESGIKWDFWSGGSGSEGYLLIIKSFQRTLSFKLFSSTVLTLLPINCFTAKNSRDTLLLLEMSASKLEFNPEEPCVVCFRRVRFYSVGSCDHPVCYECCTRMRVLCQQNECPICRQDMQKVSKLRGTAAVIQSLTLILRLLIKS